MSDFDTLTAQDIWPDVVCPEDGAPLGRQADTWVCRSGHRYRHVADIPRLMPPGVTYTDAFGLQWNRFRKTQLDSHTGAPLSKTRARRCIGVHGWGILHSQPGPQVLEVGCGAGRFTEVLLETNAHVTSVDLSSAVEANRQNFPDAERHRVFQADVTRLPFPPRQYDMVICLGVIQHTPNSEETICCLYEQVKPGGWLVIDHYTWTVAKTTKIGAHLARFFLRRMPPKRAMAWTRRLVNLLLPLHRAVRRHRALQAVLSRVSPLLTYYHCRPELNDDLQREWAVLDTYDSLTDWYKRFRTRGQIRRQLESLGAEAIWCEYGGNGVEARCRRPRFVPGARA